jgi:hypothetical protein
MAAMTPLRERRIEKSKLFQEFLNNGFQMSSKHYLKRIGTNGNIDIRFYVSRNIFSLNTIELRYKLKSEIDLKELNRRMAKNKLKCRIYGRMIVYRYNFICFPPNFEQILKKEIELTEVIESR